MVITNWLAKKDGCGGLVFPSELASGNVRIYGNVYGNPDFSEGEYVQTAIVTSYDGIKVRTVSGSEYTLLQHAPQYLNYLRAIENGAIIVKNWSVYKGKIVGRTLDSTKVEGKVIAQNYASNICTLDDGRRLFVDWLSKDPKYNPVLGHYKFLVFCTENCMPDIFCEHYHLFREKS